MTDQELKDIAGNPPLYCELQKLIENELHQFSWLGEEELNRVSNAVALAAANQGYGLLQEARKSLIKHGINPRLQNLSYLLYGALSCFEDDKLMTGIMRFTKAMDALKVLSEFLQEVEQDE